MRRRKVLGPRGAGAADIRHAETTALPSPGVPLGTKTRVRTGQLQPSSQVGPQHPLAEREAGPQAIEARLQNKAEPRPLPRDAHNFLHTEHH